MGAVALVRSMAADLTPWGASALCLAPGFTATEAIVTAMGGRAPGSDSVALPWLAVRALVDDPDVGRHAGRTLSVAAVADKYGLVDPDPAPRP